jgi:aspartyl-tRNA(Asn)/glutamyl-tRNA(Gln) amidotransferase subunit A
MHNETLSTLASLLDKKELSSVELTQHYLKRIEQLNPELNAVVSTNTEKALAAAHHADHIRATENPSILTGIPILHKDIFCTEGETTSCASKMLANFISPYESTVTERLALAGMVPLGKTNMDEFAMGSSNENSFYGAVKNPWDTKCVPGGSSGGSAAAVAALMAPAATGTDTGGSIRQPAAFCGITGIKPTYGRVSRWGMIAFASSLDQGGILARTAEDCALVLQQMAGFDPKDSTSVDKTVPAYSKTLNDTIKHVKVGIPKEYFGEGLDPAIRQVIDQALQELQKTCQIELVDVSLPTTEAAVPAYYVIAPAECSSNLSRFDGVRYGYRCDTPKDLMDLYKRSRGEAFGDEVKRRILIGTYVLSEGYYDAYYLKAQRVRRLISEDFKKAFESVDLLLTPVSPTTAFERGSKCDDPVKMYLSDIYTIAVSLAGLPALSMPAGFVDNMPVGIQLIGNYFDEAKLLNVAHQYQSITSWHRQTPKGV